MNKKFISLIATSIMLAAPNIHAMAGYNFYFGKPKTESVPLDECISSMLPQELRLSQEYRDEIKYMKEKAGITTPTICAKISSDRLTGATRNYGVGPLRFAILQLNEEDMNSIHPAFSTHTIAHELTHVERNHVGAQNAALNTALLGLAGLALSFRKLKKPAALGGLALTTGTIGALAYEYTERYNAGPNHAVVQSAALLGLAGLALSFQKLKKPAALGGLALTTGTIVSLAIDTEYAKQTSRYVQYETEAEEGAVEKLSKLGYCKALEQEFQIYKKVLSTHPNSTRINGNIYPTLGEYISMTEKACKACKGINPAERPDTPKLMRNGTPVVTWTQWFASFFGGGK